MVEPRGGFTSKRVVDALTPADRRAARLSRGEAGRFDRRGRVLFGLAVAAFVAGVLAFGWGSYLLVEGLRGRF